MADFERDDDLPLSREETRRLKPRKAAGKVPKELAVLEDSAPPTKEVKFIKRAARAATRKSDSQATLKGHAPPWIAVSFSPKRTKRPPPPIVTLRGERLDPLAGNIYQPDDRRAYNDTTYPWGCVCRITRPDGMVGSGVLIGPRHVLTASHVVEWTSSVAERIEVHLAGNSARATAFTQTAYAFTQINNVTSTTVDEDYAVITLTQRLGDRFGFFGAKVYDSAWDDEPVWETMGYAGDVPSPNFPHFQQRVSLDEDEFDLGSGRAMATSADAMPGQSGSPMFGRWAGDPIAYAVAVISASQGSDNYCAGGDDLNRIIAHARATDP
jgi:V8-like Glu-specific endopeptidase